jgi:hypothetical protein
MSRPASGQGHPDAVAGLAPVHGDHQDAAVDEVVVAMGVEAMDALLRDAADDVDLDVHADVVDARHTGAIAGNEKSPARWRGPGSLMRSGGPARTDPTTDSKDLSRYDLTSRP